MAFFLSLQIPLQCRHLQLPKDDDLLMSQLHDPRVLFAAERTLMAWQRTSLALVAFGFAIERAGWLAELLLHKSNNLSSVLIGSLFMLLGIAVCLYATRQYQKILLTLNDDEIPAKYRPQWGVAVSYAIAMLSMVLLLSLLLPLLRHL